MRLATSKLCRKIWMLLLAAMMTSTLATAGTVYRHVDEDGNVSFSDEPQSEDSEAMELEPVPSISLPQPRRQQQERTRDRERERERNEQQGYENLRITQPEHDSAFWRGAGDVTIQVSSTPELRRGHRYQLEVGGEKQGTSRDRTFNITNMDRGTHEAVVHIINQNDEIIKSSDTVRFTLHRPSVLN